MNMSRRSVVLVTVVAILGIIAYYPLDPSESVLFPKCPFFWLTGYKCPDAARKGHCINYFIYI